MDEKYIKSNYIKHFTVSTLNRVATMLSSGAIVQTLLAYFGVAFERVEIYTSITLIVQVISMFVCTVIADKFRNLKIVISVCTFILPTIFISLLLPSVGALSDTELIYTVILIGSVICNLALGVYNVLCYKLPYQIYPIKNYGKVTSIEGIFAYGVSVGSSFLLSLFVGLYDYRLVMSIAFSIGSVIWIICAVIVASYKIIDFGDRTEERDDKDVGIKEFLTHPMFIKTMLPTFVRGIGTGIFGLVVTLGLRQEILNTETATYTTFITSSSAVLGSLLYLFVERRMRHNVAIIIFGTLTGLFIPFIVVGNNLIMFYVFYFLANAAITAASIAHPVLVTETIDYKMMGRYTAWRMLVMTFGQSLPGFFIGALYDVIGAPGVLTVGGALSFTAYLWLGLVMKRKEAAA
ncbi:MAG: MFS transporter [Clostridia bacterium]|nr:MFS transporter [Clostridia bacterium]